MRAWRAILSGAAASAVVLLVAVSVSWACDGCGGGAANLDNRAVSGRAFDWSAVTTGQPRREPSAPARCEYRSVSAGEFAEYFDQALRDALPFGARFYRVRCDGGDWRYGWWVPGRSVHRDGAFNDLLQEAIDRLAPGIPVLALSPDAAARHVIAVPTWLAVTPASYLPLSRTVTAGEASVVLRLDPREIVWTTGDGTALTCDGPGARFDPTVPWSLQVVGCAHAWTSIPAEVLDDPGAVYFPVTARVVYDASYTLRLGSRTSTGALGWVTGPRARADVEVRELQAVRIAPR
jgi:hypothetical protein